MLNFFRKYQKIFFFFIAIITIVSITFFGTYRNVDAFEKKVSNRELVKGLDGKWIREQDVKGLAYLLDNASGLSGDLLVTDFFENGLIELIADRYFANFKRDLEARLSKVKSYRPYAHPQAPFLSATSVWSIFSPELAQTLAALQAGPDEATPETLKQLLKLYRLQIAFPPETLKRILFYQHSQYSWLAQDEHLIRDDLSLFRFKTMEDWFGEQFAYVLSEFILNAAAYAEQKGYQVTKEEAFAHLLQNAHYSVQAYQNQEAADPNETRQYLTRGLQTVGLDEAQGVALWRKALLCRRVFDETGASLFLDPLLHQKFAAFASEKAVLDRFEMPAEFRLTRFRDLLKFQVYLESISPKARGLSLPAAIFSVEEIEKRAPELVQRSFGLELLHVKKEDLIQSVSLKEAWDWELDEKNWEGLTKEFPLLALGKVEKREERFKLLEQLEPAYRLKVDRFAKGKIVDTHPEWLEDAFQKQTLTKLTLGIRLEEGIAPLEGIEDLDIFLAHLQDAPLKSESSEPDLALHAFTQDRENYYRIWVIEKPVERNILTYQAADREGVLERLLEKRLEAAYPEIRRKEPTLFQDGDGEWKPLSEVTDQVGLKLYADLCKLIDDHYGSFKSPEQGLDFYAHYRFFANLKEARTYISKNDSDITWVNQGAESGILAQWKLIKSREEVTRGTTPEAFQISQGMFSDVNVKAGGNAHFFQLIERKSDEADVMTEINTQQKLLGKEAKHALMHQILGEIAKKNAIDLSHLLGDGRE